MSASWRADLFLKWISPLTASVFRALLSAVFLLPPPLQYVLAYQPANAPRDGKWHKIRVKLRLPKRLAFLQAHVKTGYYAPAE